MNSTHRHAQPADTDGEPEFGVTRHRLDDGAVLAVTGELDMATAPALRSELEAVLAAGGRRLVIDLHGVDFIDSVALAVLIGTARTMGDQGRLAVVVARDSYGMLIFEAGGIDAVLPIFETRSEAIAHVQS